MKEKIYTGLMGSGKSKELISLCNKEKEKFIVLNAVIKGQNGEPDIVTSRNGQSIKSIQLSSDSKVGEIEFFINQIIISTKIKVIYLDEVQFLSAKQVNVIERVCSFYGVDLNFFGLGLDFKAEYFPATQYLLMNLSSDNIIRLPRKCEIEDCNKPAEYNARIVNGKIQRTGQLFESEKALYKALCAEHYYL